MAELGERSDCRPRGVVDRLSSSGNEVRLAGWAVHSDYDIINVDARLGEMELPCSVSFHNRDDARQAFPTKSELNGYQIIFLGQDFLNILEKTLTGEESLSVRVVFSSGIVFTVPLNPRCDINVDKRADLRQIITSRLQLFASRYDDRLVRYLASRVLLNRVRCYETRAVLIIVMIYCVIESNGAIDVGTDVVRHAVEDLLRSDSGNKMAELSARWRSSFLLACGYFELFDGRVVSAISFFSKTMRDWNSLADDPQMAHRLARAILYTGYLYQVLGLSRRSIVRLRLASRFLGFARKTGELNTWHRFHDYIRAMVTLQQCFVLLARSGSTRVRPDREIGMDFASSSVDWRVSDMFSLMGKLGRIKLSE
jgi:hypothetical protein